MTKTIDGDLVLREPFPRAPGVLCNTAGFAYGRGAQGGKAIICSKSDNGFNFELCCCFVISIQQII